MTIQTLKTITQSFVSELKQAKKKHKTSLPFIIHQIPKTPLVKEKEMFQVIKIGGSILQKSLVQKHGKDVRIRTLIEERLPVLNTKDTLLSIIDKHFDPRVSVLVLNFAYPMQPVFEHKKLDGVLCAGSKEHALQGLVGQKIGATIEMYIRSKYDREIRVSVANDAICLTLAGLTKHPAHVLAGGIVGTGVNFAFFLDDTHIVNLESANFDAFDQSPEGKVIDAQSLSKGKALFEKEVAGGYLFHHLNILFAKNKIRHPSVESTHHLDRLARGDIHTVSKLAQGLFRHSAALIACQIAGITQFMGYDMVFIMEGTLFWAGWRYKRMVEQYVKQLVPQYTVTFEEIRDCGIIGAAMLV